MKPELKKLTLLGMAASLAACSLAPQYDRPDSPVVQQLQQLEPNVATAARLSEISWRDFYRDPQLHQLLDQALQNNRDLRLAALNVEQVQAQYRIQRAALLPGLSGTASATRQRVPEAVSPTGSPYINTQYSAGLAVTAWELDLFGRVNSLRDSALQQYFATQEARRSVQLSLAAQLGESYFSWVFSRSQLDLAEATLARQQSAYQMVQQRQAAGLASSLELSQAASELHAARADIARYQRQLNQSLTALELLVGSPLPPGQLDGALANADQSVADIPAQLDSQVLLMRPDILQAEHQLRAANANIGAARASFFPRIALTANGGSASADLDGLFHSGSTAWSFVPQISLPIFTWGANRATLDVAKLRKDAAVAQYERAIQVAFKEALDSLQASQTLNDQVVAQQDLVEAASRTLALAEQRYEKGVDSFLELLVSQRTLSNAQQALIIVRQAQINNSIALFRALGGGMATL